MSTTIIIVLMICYFIPTIIAGARAHKNGMPIMMVNLFLGWTFIGWFIAFIWSLTDFTKK